jgi:hypothetical protein
MDLSYGHSPFPFSDRPVLPHIDAYQENRKLKIIKDHLSASKSLRSHHENHQQQLTLSSHHLDNETYYGYFLLKDIKHVFKFIKSSTPHSTIADQNYGFTLDELEIAFRKVKRAIKNREEEYYARRLMNTFEFLLKIKGSTPKQWFKLVDTSQANKGDGKLTWLEFEAGMNNLCSDLGAQLFSKHDLIVMLKYLDPNGDGDLSYHEVTKGFLRIHQMADCKAIILDSGPIIPYLQEFMRERQIRVRDLFNFLDIKNKKSVTLEVFCEGIARVASFISPDSSEQQINQEELNEEENGQQPLSLTVPSPSLHSNSQSPSPPKSADSSFMKKKLHRELVSRSKIHLPPVKHRSNNFESTSQSSLSPSHLNNSSTSFGYSQQSSQRGYERQVKKQFREYDDWLKQFDRKLQNGLILMSKM